MKLVIITLIIVVVFCGFSIPFIIRAKARTRADDIIFGHQPGTEERINKCISILVWTNRNITNRTDQDSLRLIQLRDMLKEIQKPHWTG